LRLVWYLLQVLTEDIEVQKNGIVLILYDAGQVSTKQYNRAIESQIFEIIINVFPCYIAGTHLCFTSKVFKLFLPLILHSFGRNLRSRLCLHTSTYSLLAKLEDYGLSENILPKQMGGKLVIDANAWKRDRDWIDFSSYRKSNLNSSRIDSPQAISDDIG